MLNSSTRAFGLEIRSMSPSRTSNSQRTPRQQNLFCQTGEPRPTHREMHASSCCGLHFNPGNGHEEICDLMERLALGIIHKHETTEKTRGQIKRGLLHPPSLRCTVQDGTINRIADGNVIDKTARCRRLAERDPGHLAFADVESAADSDTTEFAIPFQGAPTLLEFARPESRDPLIAKFACHHD